jgi:Anti-sigma factor NepR
LFVVERILSKSKKREPKPMRFVNAVDPDFDPISAALRQMHEGVANEPVPAEFLLLLDQLDAKIAEKDKKPS